MTKRFVVWYTCWRKVRSLPLAASYLLSICCSLFLQRGRYTHDDSCLICCEHFCGLRCRGEGCKYLEEEMVILLLADKYSIMCTLTGYSICISYILLHHSNNREVWMSLALECGVWHKQREAYTRYLVESGRGWWCKHTERKMLLRTHEYS